MANGRMYSEDDDATIVRVYREHQGRNGWAIAAAKLLGRSAQCITKRKGVLVERGMLPTFGVSDEAAAVQEWVARRDAGTEEANGLKGRMAALYDFVRPVELPPLERPKVVRTPASAWVISSDHHWGCHDERARNEPPQYAVALDYAFIFGR